MGGCAVKAAWLQGCLATGLLGCKATWLLRPTGPGISDGSGPGISDGPGPVIPCSLLSRVNGESLLAIEHGLPLFAAHRTLGLRALRSATWGPRALSTGLSLICSTPIPSELRVYVSDVGPSGIERSIGVPSGIEHGAAQNRQPPCTKQVFDHSGGSAGCAAGCRQGSRLLAAGLQAARLQGSMLLAARLQAAGCQAAGLQAPGCKAQGCKLQAARLQAARLQISVWKFLVEIPALKFLR